MERREPAQDRCHWAAGRGLLSYPFGVRAHLALGSTKQLKMVCSRTKWLPTFPVSAGQAGLSYLTFNTEEKLTGLHTSPARDAEMSFRLLNLRRAEVKSLLWSDWVPGYRNYTGWQWSHLLSQAVVCSFHPPKHPQQKCIDKPMLLRSTEKVEKRWQERGSLSLYIWLSTNISNFSFPICCLLVRVDMEMNSQTLTVSIWGKQVSGMLYDLSHLFFQLSSFHEMLHCQLIGIYGSSPCNFDKVFYVCCAGSSNRATCCFLSEWRMPPSPSFQSSQVWTHLLKSFTCSAWEIRRMKTIFRLGNEFQSK